MISGLWKRVKRNEFDCSASDKAELSSLPSTAFELNELLEVVTSSVVTWLVGNCNDKFQLKFHDNTSKKLLKFGNVFNSDERLKPCTTRIILKTNSSKARTVL